MSFHLFPSLLSSLTDGGRSVVCSTTPPPKSLWVPRRGSLSTSLAQRSALGFVSGVVVLGRVFSVTSLFLGVKVFFVSTFFPDPHPSPVTTSSSLSTSPPLLVVFSHVSYTTLLSVRVPSKFPKSSEYRTKPSVVGTRPP